MDASNEVVIMEQIALYLTALPCPPIPVKVTLTLKNNEHKQGICTSHDLLAGMLIAAMDKNDKNMNENRKTKQLGITERFITSMEKLNQQASEDEIYKICQIFTAEYLDAFDDILSNRAIEFISLDGIAKGDKAHNACCSWSAAQDIQHIEPSERHDAVFFKKHSFGELLLYHKRRIQSTY